MKVLSTVIGSSPIPACLPGSRSSGAVSSALALALAAAVLALPSVARAGTPFSWIQQLPANAPSARARAALAPHPGDGTVVLFGGGVAAGSPPSDETWTWNGVDWTQRSPAHHPSGRWSAAMALDPSTGKVLLFGGGQPSGIFGSGGYLGDTWTWDGSDWTQLTPQHSPAARSGAALAYDPHTGHLLLFGGNGCTAVPHTCIAESRGDTWTWTGSDWSQLDPLHDPLSAGGVTGVLDEGASSIVLFGGEHCSVGVCTLLADQYTWSGTDWNVHLPPHHPTPRNDAAGAYDSDAGGVLLFGGYDGSRVSDTWLWDGGDWTQQTPSSSPSARTGAAMSPDPANPGLVLFGGGNELSLLGDTWLWTTASPVALTPPAAPVHVGAALTLDGAGITAGTVLKVFLSTATGTIDLTPDGLAPTSTTLTTWTGTLPFGWPVGGGAASSLGNGFVALQLVRTDQGYDTSETRGAVLLGNPAVGVPSVTALDGTPLSPTSTELVIGTANVEGLVTPGASLTIGGEGFDQPRVNIFTAEGNVGPLVPTSATGATVVVDVPGDTPVGPGSVQVINATGAFLGSNAVAIPIGETIGVTGVSISTDVVTVTGTGFNALTVVNLFASAGGSVVNAGGLDGSGNPLIAVTVDDAHQLHFTRPAGLDAGAAYVQAVNPPFIPFTSSGDGAGGAFVLP